MDRIMAANDLGFRIGFSGHSGHLRLEPLPPVERFNPLNSLPDFILPPAFAPETPETVKNHIEETYLCPNLDCNEFSAEKAGRLWEFDWFDRAKIHSEPSVPRLLVAPVWELPFRRSKDEDNPQLWYPKSVQIDVLEHMEEGQGSSIFPRMPGPAKDFVRGSINNRPFRPGGLDYSQSSERTLPEGAQNGDWICEIINGGIPQSVPPSFRKGFDLGYLKGFPHQWKQAREQNSSADNSVAGCPVKCLIDDDRLSVQFDDLFKKSWEEDVYELGGIGGSL